MQISIALDGRVFFIERGGDLKIYKPEEGVVAIAGHLDVTTNLEGNSVSPLSIILSYYTHTHTH
jgi:hypothetical protein